MIVRASLKWLVLGLSFALGCQASCRSATQSPPAASSTSAPAVGLAPPAVPSQPRTPASRPQNKKDCDACRGDWGKHGISEAEGCLCRTKDVGKVCRDGAECEGQCLVGDDSKFEVASPGPPPRGFYAGRCSEFDTTFGCIRVIERGARARGPMPADQVAQSICVD